MTTQVMTDIEIIVYDWLMGRGIAFKFQTSLMGGFYQLGGAVVDFIITDRNLAWRIFGEYYHRGVEKEGSDLIQREMLTELGFTIVDIWGDDVKDRTDQTLNLALEGREVLK